MGRVTESITAEDLRIYFSQFGEVTDVYIPKPFRSFAFVTFDSPDTAQNMIGEDHIIKGVSVHVSEASPRYSNHSRMQRAQRNGIVTGTGIGTGTGWPTYNKSVTTKHQSPVDTNNGAAAVLSALGVLGVNPAMFTAVHQMGVNLPSKNPNTSSASQRYDYGSSNYNDPSTNLSYV